MVKVTLNTGEVKEFGQGEYTAERGDFPNDAVVDVSVPFGWEAKVSRDYGDAGTHIGLEGGLPGEPKVHNMAEIGLGGAVSWIGVQDLTGGVGDKIGGLGI